RQAFGWPVVLFAELSAAVAVICGFVSSGSAPWLITHALAATALFLLYLLLTTFQPYIRQARLAGAMLGASVLATSGWAGTAADVADRAALIGLCLAGASTLMAIVSVLAAVETRINPSAWFVVVARAWRETAAASALLSIGISFRSNDFPSASLLTFTLASLAATAFLLAWRYRQPSLAWLAARFLLAALLDFFVVLLADWAIVRPMPLAF